jgi:hypothetical protein
MTIMTTDEPKPTPKERTTVYLPAQLRRDVEAAAEGLGQSLSTFVTRTLSAAVRSAGAEKQA